MNFVNNRIKNGILSDILNNIIDKKVKEIMIRILR